MSNPLHWSIFRIGDPNALKIVSELGFGNIAIGALGVLSLFNAAWIVPAAVAMLVFYALAGGQHVRNAERTSSENWAMGRTCGRRWCWSDIGLRFTASRSINLP
jgi:hypothetical protein